MTTTLSTVTPPRNVRIEVRPYAASTPAEKVEAVREVVRAVNAWAYGAS